nr:PREDICTED: butyrophilin-like protein 2 [Latimeria chalumnae]|eukprot:XP_014353014.1 PREDICTED: butyrophilin-like protein 2 [Latimeria chalumnae]
MDGMACLEMGFRFYRNAAAVLLCWWITFTLSQIPKLTGNNGPVIAFVGEDAILPCQLTPKSTSEDMEVQWKKTGEEANQLVQIHPLSYQREGQDVENRYNIFTEELASGNTSLKIVNVQLSDAGKYICHVRSVKMSNEIIINFIVVEKFNITSTTPVLTYVGSDAIIPCQLTPKHMPVDMEVQWLKYDDDIIKLVHVHKTSSVPAKAWSNEYMNRTILFTEELTSGNVSLKILSVQLSDKGKYKCLVKSRCAFDEIEIILQVTDGSAQSISPWIAALGLLSSVSLLAFVCCKGTIIHFSY